MFINRINGVIVGASEESQPSWTNEQIADDNPELLAYLGIAGDGLPPRPSPDYLWNGESWVQVPPDQKWRQLKNALRGSDLFGLAATTASSNAFSLLLSVFESRDSDSDRLADLQYAIALVRAGLATDYTPEQLGRFRAILADCGLPSDWI